MAPILAWLWPQEWQVPVCTLTKHLLGHPASRELKQSSHSTHMFGESSSSICMYACDAQFTISHKCIHICVWWFFLFIYSFVVFAGKRCQSHFFGWANVFVFVVIVVCNYSTIAEQKNPPLVNCISLSSMDISMQISNTKMCWRKWLPISHIYIYAVIYVPFRHTYDFKI